MKITCHSCGAKYTVSDEKVQGKTVKMKCRKCSSTIVVGASAQADGSHGAEDATALHQTDAAAESPPPGSFLVSVSDNDQRTMTLAEVVEAYNAGVITAETYVFSDGMADWQGLAENEQIVAALNEAAQATASMGGTNGSHAAATPSPAPAAAAYAAPAATPAIESKPAAARRDGNRKSADLFGGGGLATESSSGSFGGGALAASSSMGTSTGKREENSVLFSLNALTAAAPAPAPRASVTTATKEDSGLIDLKALSANAPAAAAPTQAAAPMVDAIGLFPLGAPVAPPPPPPSAATYAAPAAPPQSNLVRNLGLAIGGVIALCAVIAVFILARGGNDPKPAETTQAQTTPTAPTATALSTTPTTTTTTTTAVASEQPVGDASESTSASTKPKTGPVGPRPTGKPTGTTTSTGGKTTATATGAPKALPCGCKPGDVDCAIKCSMKKK